MTSCLIVELLFETKLKHDGESEELFSKFKKHF